MPFEKKKIVKTIHIGIYGKFNIFSVKSTFLLKKLLKSQSYSTFPHCGNKICRFTEFLIKISGNKLLLHLHTLHRCNLLRDASISRNFLPKMTDIT